MDVYTVAAVVFGTTITAVYAWAVLTDDLGDQTGQPDGMGQHIEPEPPDHLDDLARAALGEYYTDLTRKAPLAPVVSIWRGL